MGFFDFFKKKPETEPEKPTATAANVPQTEQPQSSHENKLETALRLASEQPAYRPEFYRLLLSEDLVVLTDGKMENGDRVLEQDTEVGLLTFQGGKIPAFTSVERVFDKGVITQTLPFMAMNGAALFDVARGATIILNPYSDFSKELLPDEISSMLDGTILTEGQNKIVAKKDTQVLLGQPVSYPDETVNSLRILFAGKPEVKNAYLGIMSEADSDEIPILLFGIETDGGDFQTIVNEAGFTAQQFLKEGEAVNFIKIGDHSMDDYFIKHTEPFYTRK